MASLTIEIPDELAEAFESLPPLSADAIEIRDLIVWNIRLRASELVGWAEGASPGDRAGKARRLGTELDALTAAHAGLVGEPVEAGAA